MEGARLSDELRKLLGPSKVSFGVQDLASYSSDMFPRNQILKLGGKTPEVGPAAVCFPEDVEDVSALMAFCTRERVPAVPYGAGSGVCGSALPVEGCVMVDMKRMNRMISVDGDGGTATVEPGIVGENLELLLNRDGLTLGHFPSSINCSTLGGYVACRSAGQFSSRYGKIEDLTLGLEIVRPGGTVCRLGLLGGGHHKDPALALFLGSEGTLGIITKVCIRVEPLPEKMDFRGFAFLDIDDGLLAMKRIMQSGTRPTVLRLYDPLDSLVAGFHSRTASGEDVHAAASRLTGKKGLLASALTELNQTAMALALLRPSLLNRMAEILPTRALMVAGVQGDKTDVTRQWNEVFKLTSSARGDDLGPEPGYNWFRRRYAVSYKQSRIYAAGAFVDTMEVATTWENILPLYQAVLKAMSNHVFIMAHFSHAYAQGCSIYFTFAGYRPSAAASGALYHRAWKDGLEAVLRHGGTISHHHGVGVLKKWAMDRETPGGRILFGAFKKALDPHGVMNPGKVFNLD